MTRQTPDDEEPLPPGILRMLDRGAGIQPTARAEAHGVTIPPGSDDWTSEQWGVFDKLLDEMGVPRPPRECPGRRFGIRQRAEAAGVTIPDGADEWGLFPWFEFKRVLDEMGVPALPEP